MNKDIKVIDYGIIDETDDLGVSALSFVKYPAIEVNFMTFAKQERIEFKKIEGEQRMIFGPVLIPDQMIYRKDDKTQEEWYARYSKEAIKEIAYRWIKRNMQNNATYEHEFPVSGVNFVESWIQSNGQDKAVEFGFNTPPGTWFVGAKVTNDQVWESIKAGEVMGISLEGWFAELSEELMKVKDVEKMLKEFEQELGGML
jgi:hypothetical protein